MTVHTPTTFYQVKLYNQNAPLNYSHKNLNKALSLARATAKLAFVKRALELLCQGNNIENIPDIILACCILSNITQLKGDNYLVYDDLQVL